MQAKLSERSQEINEINPTPEQLKTLRESHGLTQLQAAYIVHVSEGTWQRWEAGDLEMPQKLYELFCTKIK
ncbi:MAG: helix-turn-helix domain-containing protein [Porticoccaceae bacterium]|nr:helix-turn-helix domain-containing protein [Porticoccaceae bacterium]